MKNAKKLSKKIDFVRKNKIGIYKFYKQENPAGRIDIGIFLSMKKITVGLKDNGFRKSFTAYCCSRYESIKSIY